MQDFVDRLQTAVDVRLFFDILEEILTHVTEPVSLARCAQTAGLREPGGPFYRAKLWRRAEELRENAELKGSRKTLGLMCVEVPVAYSDAKQYIAQGQAIYEAEKITETAKNEGHAFADLSVLRQISSSVLQYAVMQRDRAAEYLIEAASFIEEHPLANAIQIHNSWCQDNGGIKANLDIIKPSDWWAFSHPKWRRDDDFPGSIPGEIYANSLYYFAPLNGIAVDPMAGSGMLKRVYDDRDRWQRDLEFDLEIYLYDINPQRSFIQKHDATLPLPIMADWIFLDPPYFGQSSHLYAGELASVKSYSGYLESLSNIIRSSVASLNSGGRLCLLLPKWSGLDSSKPNYNLPADAANIALSQGVNWIDTAFVSRARQQEGGSAIKNNTAKRNRRMMSDCCVLNVFEKQG